MVARYLLVWFLLVSLAAWQWPAGWVDPFLAVPKAHLPWLIFAAMFCIGAMLPRDEVRQVARRWPAVVLGTMLQYTSMPALAYWMARLFQLGPDDFIGLMVVGCVPGAMASNVLTLNAHGNASYSVGLTTLATLLSPLAVPLALGLTLTRLGEDQTQYLINAAVQLLWSVVLPVLLGFGVTQRFRTLGAQLVRQGPTVANVLILWVIGAVIAANRASLSHFDPRLILALTLTNLGGYLAGYFGGWAMRLDEPMRRALTIEIGMQNAGLGAALALSLFPDRTATAIAPALFMFGCMLSGALLTQSWRWWDDRHNPRPSATASNP